MKLELKNLSAYLPYSVRTNTGVLTCSIIDRREKKTRLLKILKCTFDHYPTLQKR